MTEFCLKILNSLHQVSVSLLNVVEAVFFFYLARKKYMEGL